MFCVITENRQHHCVHMTYANHVFRESSLWKPLLFFDVCVLTQSRQPSKQSRDFHIFYDINTGARILHSARVPPICSRRTIRSAVNHGYPNQSSPFIFMRQIISLSLSPVRVTSDYWAFRGLQLASGSKLPRSFITTQSCLKTS